MHNGYRVKYYVRCTADNLAGTEVKNVLDSLLFKANHIETEIIRNYAHYVESIPDIEKNLELADEAWQYVDILKNLRTDRIREKLLQAQVEQMRAAPPPSPPLPPPPESDTDLPISYHAPLSKRRKRRKSKKRSYRRRTKVKRSKRSKRIRRLRNKY
ncbi:MAG: hypothetical protein CME61_09750 [Halobacteriovoraceae bacterium]|nr:hypothetical protein [Halobacteriovoraceae bacterium]